jgi:DNA repair protein RecN (Recombination protein N)
VVTGETGAGKSILVNALTLALGGRASADLIRSGAETAEVEALFDISRQVLIRQRLADRELLGDDPDLLVVRRVVGSKGRAKVVINGRLASVATLGELVRGLVDISGQHEQQSLLVVDNHLGILDDFGAYTTVLDAFGQSFAAWRRLVAERAALDRSEEELLSRADYVRFQLEEIDRVAPIEGEIEALEQERARLVHADRLKRGAAAAEAALYGEDGSAFDKLSKAAAELEALTRIDVELAPVAAVLESTRKELQEAARELGRYDSRIEADPDRLAAVDDRLAELKRLIRKHGGSLNEVLRRQTELRQELDTLDSSDARLAELERELAATAEQMQAAAAALSSARRDAATRLSRAVASELAELNLDGAVFEVAVTPRAPAGEDGTPAVTADGADAVEFLWSANPGEPPRPLVRIVSGGELSRLMLAVKRVLSQTDLVSLYVFDEVDAGLGGRVADAIGRKIQAVAGEHQAIAITHLAPIAACAHHHLVVRKELRLGRAVSVIARVSGKERAEELARMIDGANVTKATRQAAREMLARSPEV